MKIFRKLTCLLIVLSVLSGKAVGAETQPINSPWSRITMIGASASAGFVMSELLGGTNTTQCRLSYYLDAAIAAPHQPVNNLANRLFFLTPDAQGPSQIQQALATKPTLVIAVDFLFWFCYGQGNTDAERLEHFEKGLKLLDEIKCPLVIGDIPDAASATNTGMLSIAQVPSPAARASANKRIKDWASSRSNVAVVPLADFMSTVMANRALTVHGQTLAAGKTHAIMQEDELHPKPLGSTFLALGILDTFVSKFPESVTASDIRWNHEDVLRIGYAAAEKASRLGK